MSERVADWTKGVEAIVYQSCGACGKAQYFHRSFCAACGAPEPVTNAPAGQGRSMRRRWSAAPRRRKPARMCPITFVLVDTVEGFRMMAHGDNDLAIGDKVTARYQQFAGRLVPYFAKAK